MSGPIKVIQLANGSWAVATADSQGNVQTGPGGAPNILVGAGTNALFSEKSKNAGNVDYASLTSGSSQTTATLGGDTADGPTGMIAWENSVATRRSNGTYTAPGDADYNDAVFRISIVPNRAPVAVADVATAIEAGGVANGTPGVNPAGNVLINDIDPDAGDSKTVSAVGGLASKVGQAVAGAYGTLTLNADGSYSYVVNNANGSVQGLRTASDTLTDSFTYTVKDLAGVTSSTTLKVTIKGANDAPVAVADVNGSDAVKEAGSVAGDTSAKGNVLTNDTDPELGRYQDGGGSGGRSRHGTVVGWSRNNFHRCVWDVDAYSQWHLDLWAE